MQKITTHLWFDKEAREAAQLYTSVFPNSKIINSSELHDTPSGSVDILEVELAGQAFTLMSAGPYFKFSPAISFLVSCDTKEEVDALWQKLAPGGTVMMELASYPFSERYGWAADRFGLSWQIMFTGGRKAAQKITPTLLFVGNVAGKAEEAMALYTSVFRDSRLGDIMRYGKGEAPDKEGTIKHADFILEGMGFGAMDSAHKHEFTFTEAISFVIHCADQTEIDYYWNKLTAVPESEQCGWLKDKYGVSWQVTPTVLGTMMGDKDPVKVGRVTQAFLKMKKFDIAALEKAYRG